MVLSSLIQSSSSNRFSCFYKFSVLLHSVASPIAKLVCIEYIGTMEKSTMPTAPDAGYIPPRPRSNIIDETNTSQDGVFTSDTTAYAKEQPIRMVRQTTQTEETTDLRGGRRDRGACECCMYCCGIVVLIKCLDSLCG